MAKLILSDDRSAGLGTTPNVNKSNREPTTSTPAKLILCKVRDPADALGPLKSV